MTSANKVELPEGFLAGPAPNLTKHVIDFKKEGIPVYEGRWAVILDGVLSQDECEMLTKAAEATTAGEWERAMVNVGNGQQRLYEDTRKCGRIIWDDRDMVAKIWARVQDSVLDVHRLQNWADVTGIGPAKRKETWKVTRLNNRMRFLKYVGGEYFKVHNDGCYETPDGAERSYFTLHLYLSDAADQLKGGATTFYDYSLKQKIEVVPKSGRVLMFQHRNLLHSGDDVKSGIKYTMRTDVMYTKE
ncbi:oxidoreductase domain-containing protein [Karstenula rhodostoma CBS 690.94]|uniref:Oxidoreductase domain-containing protein n=1 Tax=Karstenula rhodostoma CBS 690.94 TaxID=1392251 RepID=A0A9P4PSW1_9PLEO|nr:oxidoreductase domain-containing protein [Karstenula rhodostoma CBS 690.94]